MENRINIKMKILERIENKRRKNEAR